MLVYNNTKYNKKESVVNTYFTGVLTSCTSGIVCRLLLAALKKQQWHLPPVSGHKPGTSPFCLQPAASGPSQASVPPVVLLYLVPPW